MFWGFSEAIDFYQEYRNCNKSEDEPKAILNILLFGCCDPRHIIKTIAKSYLHNTKINFYVFEGCPALLARNVILTTIALEPPSLLSLLAKTHLFMDIYANTQIRISSVGYIESKATHFINCVTDLEFNKRMQPIFVFNQLKYIERDCLENIFNFWRENGKNGFDVNSLWTQRMKQHLSFRYDSRFGAFDWDLNMRLKDYGAQQICPQEYRHWRETGIGLTFPEYRQSCPNRTFAIENPKKLSTDKFIGDTLVGPFCTFGLNCSDAKMLKSSHGQNLFRATDVIERNVFELFYEIEERKPLDSTLFSEHRLGAAVLDLESNVKSEPSDLGDLKTKKIDEPLIIVDQVRVFYLSVNEMQNIVDGKKFCQFFDGIFIGREYFKLVKKDFSKLFAPNAILLFETLQLSTQRKDDIAEFLKKIRCLATEMELHPLTNFNINVPLPIARYQSDVGSQ